MQSHKYTANFLPKIQKRYNGGMCDAFLGFKVRSMFEYG